MINTIESRLNLDNQSELTSLIDSSIITWSHYFNKTWALLNRLQKSEQDIYHILSKTNDLTAQQIKSLINKAQTEHAKIKELTKTQLKQKQNKLSHIEEFIKKEQKLIVQNKDKIIKLKQSLFKFKLKDNVSKGTDRRLWYINLMNLIRIKPISVSNISESNVVKRADLEKNNLINNLINNLLENPF